VANNVNFGGKQEVKKNENQVGENEKGSGSCRRYNLQVVPIALAFSKKRDKCRSWTQEEIAQVRRVWVCRKAILNWSKRGNHTEFSKTVRYFNERSLDAKYRQCFEINETYVIDSAAFVFKSGHFYGSEK